MRKKFLTLFLSALISAALIIFLLKQIKAEDLLSTFQQIQIPALLGFLLIAALGALLRAWRYKKLLHPQSITWPQILLTTLIRNLFVDLLPARIGSLSYIYILNQRIKIPFENATSSFVSAFVLDIMTLGPFLMVSLLIAGWSLSELHPPILLTASSVFFLLMLLVYRKLSWFFSIGISLLHALLRKTHREQKTWAKTFLIKMRLTAVQLREFEEQKRFAGLFTLSLTIRLAKYTSLLFLLVALLSSHGFGWGDISFTKTVLGVTGAEFSSLLPIKGIGGFGTWESAWALAFRLMKTDPKIAVISGLGVHLITNLFEYILGIFSLLIVFSPVIGSKKISGRDR